MGWQVSNLTDITGAIHVDGSVTGYAFEAQGTRHVTYVGLDFHIHEMWWNPAGWHHNDLTIATGSPKPINAGNGYVFQFGQYLPYFSQEDGNTYQLRWDNSGWHYDNLSTLTGGPIGSTGGTNGYAFPAQGTRHVLFPDGQGHIQEYWADSVGWHHNDLTNAVAAPLSSANPRGYIFHAQNTQHVIYAGNDLHIHELWWDVTGWHHNDLSAVTGAPPATPNRNSPGYIFPSQGTQHVNYVGLENHIHELWWDSNGWHHNDLTIVTGCPNSASQPIGYTLACTQHVFFVGVDNHVHELWWDNNGWHHDDLSVSAGAPQTDDEQPYGFAFESRGTKHVVYRDFKKNLIELYTS